MKSLAPLISIILLWSLGLLAQELYGQHRKMTFEKYGVEEGLPESRVSSIIQDDQGFIWFATQNGLVKYDGYHFKTYEPTPKAVDSTRLNLRNLSGGIIKGKDGKLWIGGVIASGGLASFDPRTEGFCNYLHDPSNPHSPIPYRNVYPLMEDRWGNIWLANRSSKLRKWVLCKWDTAGEQAKAFPYGITPRFNSLFQSGSGRFTEAKEDGNIWVLDETWNLRYWTPEQDSFIIVHHAGTPLPGWDRPDTISLMAAGLQSKILLRGKAGFYVWDPVAKQVDQYYEHDPKNNNSLASGAINYVFEDHYGKYWVVNYNGSMTTVDPKRQLCSRHVYGEGKMAFPDGPATIWRPLIYLSDEQELLFKDRSPGIKRFLQYDFKTESFHLYDPNFNVPENGLQPDPSVFSMFKDKSDLLWLGYFGGLYKEAPKQQLLSFYAHDNNDPNSIPDDIIINLFEDRSDRLWVPTWKGLCRYVSEKDHFEQIAFLPKAAQDATITQVYEDSEGQIWIGGQAGLFLFDEISNTARKVSFSPSEKQNVLKLLEDNQKRLWVSVEGMGIYLLDIASKQVIKSFQQIQGDRSALMSKFIVALFQDSQGKMWMGDWLDNQLGLFRYDESQEQFIHYVNSPQLKRSIGSNEIYFIFEDDWQKIWVGTDAGLFYYLKEEDRFERFGDPIEIVAVTGFAKADKNCIWIGTYSGGGLIKLNPENLSYQSYGPSEGFLHSTSNTNTFKKHLTLDQMGQVYFPTQRGLSVFDPKSEQVRNYGEEEGFRIKDSRYGSIATSNGDVWISSRKGLVRLSPESLMAQDSTLADVHITAMTILDSTYSKPDGKLFKQAVAYTELITLTHNQNDLAFDFVALHYKHPGANQYSWKLENYDEAWNQPSSRRSARYTNLNPGTYTLRVKASNADGVWNEQGASLAIVIRPPWWATWWARTLFIAALLGAAYLIYRSQLRRQLQQAEHLRLQELDKVKTRLYTNITHEFRTPLTVIQGMAEQIEEQPQTAKKLILRNGSHLLNLVNQMLDLSKLESGKLELKLIQSDVIAYLQYLIESFHSLADNKGIGLVYYPEIPALNMDYDAEKLQLIVSNLLSNAIKFSPEGSKIIVHAQQLEKEGAEMLQLKVRDKGIGIPADKLPHIFDRFYQVDDSATRKGEGTGIGLTLTKELVQLMGGSIEVESQIGQGSTFMIQLPITRNAAVTTEIPQTNLLAQVSPEALPEASHLLLAAEDQPQILIIEDNPDVILYIQSCLKDSYRLLSAENGAIGIQQALEHTPDLIISDVMMPEKDGFEVCQTLKRDERSSHIPIILLTAKTDVDSRIAGLQEGADAYLAKPFEKQELLVRIEQLIQLRRNLQARYRELHGRPVVTEGKYKREDGFVRKIKLLIEERLSDDEFHVDQLARELSMSRSQLFRKLKALTGLSVSAFIRNYRLERGRQLLKTTDLSVSEVAYEVGFKNPNHFSTAFKAAFGDSPGATRK